MKFMHVMVPTNIRSNQRATLALELCVHSLSIEFISRMTARRLFENQSLINTNPIYSNTAQTNQCFDLM